MNWGGRRTEGGELWALQRNVLKNVKKLQVEFLQEKKLQCRVSTRKKDKM